MSKGCRFVILGEDESHLRFAEKFLIQRRLATNREIFPLPIPAGRGSGEQYVRARFPTELNEIRRVSKFQRKVLLVLIDGDDSSVADRRRQLHEACSTAGCTTPQKDDPVCVLVPCRNVQTWVRFLLGNTVDEQTDYKRQVSETDRRMASVRLAEKCQDSKLGKDAPLSLQAACEEFNRLVLLLLGE